MCRPLEDVPPGYASVACSAPGVLADDVLGDAAQVGVQVAAEHVAQQRAQMAGQLGGQRVDLGVDLQAADERALERDRCGPRARSARRARRAARTARPAVPRGARMRGPRARSARAARAARRSAPRRGSRARRPSRSGAAPRPARRCAACAGRSSEQKARSSSSWWAATTIGSSPRRPRAPSAKGCHGEPPVRVHASGPKPTLAPSYRRSAVSSRRRRTRAWATGVVSPAAASQRTTTSRCGRRAPGAQRASAGASSAKASPCTSVSPSPRATSGEAISTPEQRRDDDGLGAPVVERGLDLGVGALEALGAEREVGRLLEDAAEEDAQGELGAGARLGRVAALAARLEVVAQAAQPRERVHGGQEARQPREQADALLDEVRRQRAVAVQRAVAAPAAHDLEGDLGAVGGLGGELPGRLLDEGGEGAMELAVVHGRAVRRGRGAVLPRARRLAARRQ